MAKPVYMHIFRKGSDDQWIIHVRNISKQPIPSPNGMAYVGYLNAQSYDTRTDGMIKRFLTQMSNSSKFPTLNNTVLQQVVESLKRKVGADSYNAMSWDKPATPATDSQQNKVKGDVDTGDPTKEHRQFLLNISRYILKYHSITALQDPEEQKNYNSSREGARMKIRDQKSAKDPITYDQLVIPSSPVEDADIDILEKVFDHIENVLGMSGTEKVEHIDKIVENLRQLYGNAIDLDNIGQGHGIENSDNIPSKVTKKAKELIQILNGMIKRYADILGVNVNASEEEIKQSYRSQSKTTHPDKGGNTTQFRKMNAAAKNLTNIRGIKDQVTEIFNDLKNGQINVKNAVSQLKEVEAIVDKLQPSKNESFNSFYSNSQVMYKADRIPPKAEMIIEKSRDVIPFKMFIEGVAGEGKGFLVLFITTPSENVVSMGINKEFLNFITQAEEEGNVHEAYSLVIGGPATAQDIATLVTLVDQKGINIPVTYDDGIDTTLVPGEVGAGYSGYFRGEEPDKEEDTGTYASTQKDIKDAYGQRTVQPKGSFAKYYNTKTDNAKVAQ